MNARGERPPEWDSQTPVEGTGETAIAMEDGAQAALVDEPGQFAHLLPALLLSALMALAFAAVTWTQGGMLEWAVSRQRLADGAYQLVVLHMFAHAGLFHIGFNVMALLSLGPAVMMRLDPPSLRGALAFLALFFACGLGGLALWLVVGGGADIPMLGASGAIFGLVGFILRQPDPAQSPIPLLGRDMGRAFLTFAKLHLPLLAIFAVLMLLGSGSFGLAWEAHLGGFLTGLLLVRPIRAMAGAPRPLRSPETRA